MTSRDFCFWLQGFFEISGGHILTLDSMPLIKEHLNLVFKHDPSIAPPSPVIAAQSGALSGMGVDMAAQARNIAASIQLGAGYC